MTIRVDLTALSSHAVWATTGPALARAAAQEVHLLVYPPGPVTDAVLAQLHADLVDADATRPSGVQVGTAVTVAGGRWWVHDLSTPCPPSGAGTA